MKKRRIVLLACLLSLVAAAGVVHESTATQQAALQPAAPLGHGSPETTEACLQSSEPLASAGVFAVVESQDAVDCAAGGWLPVTSGWPPGKCCGSTRHWIKFTGGANHIDKCCGACPE